MGNRLIPYAGKSPGAREDIPRAFKPDMKGARHGEPRTERVDFRLTPRDKELLRRVSDKQRRTFQSLFEEWLDELAKTECPTK